MLQLKMKEMNMSIRLNRSWTKGERVIVASFCAIVAIGALASKGSSRVDAQSQPQVRQAYVAPVEDDYDPKPRYNRMRPSGGINISQTYYKGAANDQSLIGFATLGIYDTYCDRPLPQGTWNTVDAVVRIEGMGKMLPISFTVQEEILKKKGKKAFCSNVESHFAKFLKATD